MPCTASSFIKELDPELVEHKDVGQILNAPVAEEKAAAKFRRDLRDAWGRFSPKRLLKAVSNRVKAVTESAATEAQCGRSRS